MAAAARSEQDVRWNFVCAALCGTLFELGAALVGTTTVVAAFVVRLTPSAAINKLGFKASVVSVAGAPTSEAPARR